ncbi:MAG: CPBP family intramembrane metalloprotease [Canidatus Methanoxibalbensis ujae]|nr:CPBP family intramembrane metalloprotease [Candidatus Methanoxibalbensis ujae]
MLLPIITHTISENWHFLGAFGPSISAFIMIYITEKNRGISRLKNKIIKYQVGFGWILVAISPIFLLLVSLPIGYFISGSWLDFRQFITDNLFSPISTFLWILPLISYGIFEEIGWRGFALPYLQKKFNALTATFILSIFWFLWHFPMFFYRFDFSIDMLIDFYLGLLSVQFILLLSSIVQKEACL